MVSSGENKRKIANISFAVVVAVFCLNTFNSIRSTRLITRNIMVYMENPALSVCCSGTESMSTDITTQARAPSLGFASARDVSTQSIFSSPLGPLLVLERYIQDHSAVSLRNELRLTKNFNTPQPDAIHNDARHDRKFALAYYRCPDRAGNMLHNFFSSVIWAIVTNHTILYAFYHEGVNRTEQIKQRAECDAVMQIAPWVPGWEEFSKAYNLSHATSFQMNSTSTNAKDTPRTVLFPQIHDIFPKRKDIVRGSWNAHPLETTDYRKYLSRTLDRNSFNLVKALYLGGLEVLRGMLFRHFFVFQEDPSVQVTSGDQQNSHLEPQTTTYAKPWESSTLTRNTTFRILVHSRHTVAGDDGSFISSEIKCLESMLMSIPAWATACHVYLMTDRPETQSRLTHYLVTETNCSMITAILSRNDNFESMTREHGPWAGEGFFRDLVVGSTLRQDAMIGDRRRSSFLLFVELVEYDRWYKWALQTSSSDVKDNNRTRDYKMPRKEAISTCNLPKRSNIQGYDYGPGTPTFLYHKRLPEQPPLKIMKQYIRQHSSEVLLREEKRSLDARQFSVVGKTICREEKLENTSSQYAILNDILRAVLSNRTILWYQPNCTRDLEAWEKPKSWIPLYSDWISKLESLPRKKDLVNFATVVDKLQEHDLKLSGIHLQMNITAIANISSSLSLKKKDLYSENKEFLYALLLDKSLSITGPERVFGPADYLQHDFSVGVNWPVNFPGLSNDTILSTMMSTCLDSVLHSSIRDMSNERNCIVYTMFNSQQDWDDYFVPTREFLSERNCTLEANIKDIRLTARARSGYIGAGDRDILLDRIHYLRRQEAWGLGRIPPIIPDFATCLLNDHHVMK